MTAKLFANIGKKELIKSKEKYSFEHDFYFQDSPEKVLRRIIVDYPVQKFNSLNIRKENHLYVISSKNKNNLNRLYFGGMQISEPSLLPRKLDSLENFDRDPDFNLIKRTTSPKMQEIMYSLIFDYLIEEKEIDSGHEIIKYNGKRNSIPSKWQAQFYLEVESKNIDIEKEKSLEDMIKYGKAVFGKNFGINQIKEMGSRLLEQYPIEKRPTKISFANLKPNDSLFYKHKK